VIFMVNTGQRTMKRKSKRLPSKTKKVYFKEKNSKKKCAVTGQVLSGVPHEKTKTSKKSKTQKRPSVPLGGVVGGKAREKIFIELGKVASGTKKIEDVDQKYRTFVKQVMKRVE